MKNRFTLPLLLSVLLLAACSKNDHSVEPEPEIPVETESIQSGLVGKWIVSEQGGRTQAGDAFLEFMADSTYIIFGITEEIRTGKYISSSKNAAKLQGFGEVTEVSLSQGKIICNLIASDGRKITIFANKAAEIATDERTKLLARNWALTSEEDGGAYLISDSDPNVKFDMDFTFSASGTYLITIKFMGQVSPDVIGNWKWHSTDKDRIVLWRDGEEINEDENFLVRSLSKNQLKLTAKNDTSDFLMTLVPSK